MNEFEKIKDQINKSLARTQEELASAQEEQQYINSTLANLDHHFKDERTRGKARGLLEEMKENNARIIEILTEQKKRLDEAQRRVDYEFQAFLTGADPLHK